MGWEAVMALISRQLKYTTISFRPGFTGVNLNDPVNDALAGTLLKQYVNKPVKHL